jgi:uncharacterized protein YyaL (SSP411 family)
MLNRLANETSLYLRQHANNPVDWFPWGPEALERAKQLDRPIFLSIGYSACHWCHVMEHESFESESTAKLLNEHFVCIKVDREERPDIDTIYMNALQALTREGGGWPLSVFLAPDLTPFHAGTYYPPDNRYSHHGKPSFPNLLMGIVDAWKTKRERIVDVGKQVAEFLGNVERFDSDGDLSPDLLGKAFAALRRIHDERHGGFGGAPKFPHALELRLLLRIEKRLADGVALGMVRRTLDAMARGGIYDQLAGGFARYSVDARWLVPHFEKMLYDNALLVSAYVEAWQHAGDPFHKQVAIETLEYVMDRMTANGGAFFSTEDADSEGEEGKFYVWSEAEIRDVLGTELGDFACRVWGVTAGGNFEGHNILFRARSDAEDAARLGLSEEAFAVRIAEAKEKLLAVREKRVRPGRDEKILTAWNGLMIAAFARAGAAFDDGRYVDAAINAADWCLTHLRDSSGRLFRTADESGAAKLNGYLEDYAFIAEALIALYEAGGGVKYLQAAIELADTMMQRFADPNGPGFYFTADDHEKLIARTKDLHDGSTPSGNAVATLVLLKLAKLTGRADLEAKAVQTLRGFRVVMDEHPAASGQMLAALDFHFGPVQELAVIGASDDPLLGAVRRRFHPNSVLAVHDPADGDPPAILPLLKERPPVNGEATLYVCENSVCSAPLTGEAAMRFISSMLPEGT